MQTRSSRQHRTYSESSENPLAMTIKPRPWGEAPQAQAVQRQPGPYSWRDMLPHDPSPRPAPNFLQAKLTVGAPNDVYEQEADRVAEHVMSTPDSTVQQTLQREAMPEEEEELQMKPLAATITRLVQREAMPEEEEELQTKSLGNSIQREAIPEEEEELQTKPLGNSIQREAMPEEEEEIQTKALSDSIQREAMPEEEEEIQTKRSPDAGFQAGSNLENRLSSSQGGGSPLSEEVRSFMEPRFGADFSQVRVHTGNEAVQMNQNLNAQAFTHKQDVYFGASKAPAKDALTAHELAHTIQQSGGAEPSASSLDGKEQAGIARRLQSHIGNITEAVPGIVQGSWIGDRTNWVRTATNEDNWVKPDPPGAYYILNGLSIEDMVKVLRSLTLADQKKLSDNLDEKGVGCDRPRIHLGLSNAATGSGDKAFQESSENLLWAIRSENYAPSNGAFFMLAAAKGAMRNRLLAALNPDALEALIAHSKEADMVSGGADVMAAIQKKLEGNAKSKAEKTKEKMRKEVLNRLADIINNKQGDLPLTVKVRKELISKTINELLSASKYDQVEQLETDVRQKTLVSLYMQKSQKENSKKEKGFSYPNKKQDGTEGFPARVNEAALQYWGSVQKYPGEYFFNLSPTGKANAYQAIVTLFTGQRDPRLRTLIHCDYLVSLIEYRAWAESIGISRFNENVKIGNIPLILKWDGFSELTKPVGLSDMPKSPTVKQDTPLKAMKVNSEKEFTIGDHVVFYNHPTYVPLTANTPDVWKLENAIVVNSQGGEYLYQGHGYPSPVPASTLMNAMCGKYNQHVQEALNLINAEKKAKNDEQRDSAELKRTNKYPNVHPKGSGNVWEISGRSDVTERDEKRDLKLLTPQQAPGLKSPSDGAIWVRRPDHN